MACFKMNNLWVKAVEVVLRMLFWWCKLGIDNVRKLCVVSLLGGLFGGLGHGAVNLISGKEVCCMIFEVAVLFITG